jgi:hypothetical protein
MSIVVDQCPALFRAEVWNLTNVGFVFMEYWEPRFMVGVFGALVLAMAVTR